VGDRVVGAAGVGIFGTAIVWTAVSWVASGGNPVPPALLLAAVPAVALAARAAGPEAKRWVLVGVAGTVLLLALPSALRLVAGGRLGPAPLGYPNANAALFLQGAVAALMVAATWRRASVRVGAALTAAALAGLAAVGSRATAALLVLVAVALVVAHRPWLVRVAVASGAALILAAVAGVTTVAASASENERSPLVREAVPRLGSRRVALWREAYELAARSPVVGVGPGRFRGESPTARTDRDARWAHADFLQAGAETGVPGMVLLVLAFLWGALLLWSASVQDLPVALAGVALASLGIQASGDHLLGSVALPLVTSAMVGAASSRRGPEYRPGPLLRKAVKAAALPLGLGGRREPGDVAILLYHRVGAGDREVDLPVAAFEAQVAEVSEREGVLPLDAALADGSGGVVLTIDDGYRDFHDVVLPILAHHRVPAVLYLASGLVAEEARARDLALSWTQLREAVATGLVTVGSHTHNHVDLSRASPAEAQQDIVRSKELIEDRLQVPCRHFSYPFGAAAPQAEPTIQGLFQTAALGWATNRRGRIDPYRLGRTPILRSDGRLFFRAKVRGLLDGEAAIYRAFGRGPWRRM
jgi:peptidoglycan/xylan/chitin deacetylase (PgdA/CDA1 family)